LNLYESHSNADSVDRDQLLIAALLSFWMQLRFTFRNSHRAKKMTTPSFLNNGDLQLVLFGGKGGVGKTTCATAAALFIARRSPRNSFLLVSTDPAHSLADSMAGSLPPENLKIIEFNARECMATFKEMHSRKLRDIARRGTFLDEEDIGRLLDISFPGLDELMAFLEISRLVEDRSYDGIVVDTAPTGHTIRLLLMPELIRKWAMMLDALLAKHRYMKKLFKGSYRRDELDHFIEGLIISVRKMEALLQDRDRCRFVPIMLAEALSVKETVMLVNELEHLRIALTDIVVNRLYPENSCPTCSYNHEHQMKELTNFFLDNDLSRYSLWGIPFYPVEICGAKPLAFFWEKVTSLNKNVCFPIKVAPDLPPRVEAAPECPGTEMTLLLFAGKGGVGKTTLACATAVRLAWELQGKEVLLFSADPAHSLSACLDVPVGPKPMKLTAGLTAMEIDAQKEFETLKKQYADELERFLQSVMPNIDLKFDRQVMERIMDLAPPGLDEIMALTLAMEFLATGDYDFFIFDSAPTGHLIRLLELPEIIDQWLKLFFCLFLKYKRVFRLPGITQRLVQMSKNVKNLRALLNDSTRSALYAVSILTEMAFEETKDLVTSCERMRVHVPVLFLNLATRAGECSLCSSLSLREEKVRGKFQRTFPSRHQTLIYRQSEPRGIKRLYELGQVLYQPGLITTIDAGINVGITRKSKSGKDVCQSTSQ
jgi:arsenite-transporting ATPase